MRNIQVFCVKATHSKSNDLLSQFTFANQNHATYFFILIPYLIRKIVLYVHYTIKLKERLNQINTRGYVAIV